MTGQGCIAVAHLIIFEWLPPSLDNPEPSLTYANSLTVSGHTGQVQQTTLSGYSEC